MEFGLSSIEAASQVSVLFPQSEFAELIGAPVSSELINAMSEADTADFWARLLLIVPESQAKASFALFAASALIGGSYLRDIRNALFWAQPQLPESATLRTPRGRDAFLDYLKTVYGEEAMLQTDVYYEFMNFAQAVEWSELHLDEISRDVQAMARSSQRSDISLVQESLSRGGSKYAFLNRYFNVGVAKLRFGTAFEDAFVELRGLSPKIDRWFSTLIKN